jgi:hypothetical protein
MGAGLLCLLFFLALCCVVGLDVVDTGVVDLRVGAAGLGVNGLGVADLGVIDWEGLLGVGYLVVLEYFLDLGGMALGEL